MDELAMRWAAVHASSLEAVRALATKLSPAPATVARLPPGVLDSATLAAVLAAEQGGAPAAEELSSRVLDELEEILEEMHALTRAARGEVAAAEGAAHSSLQLSAAEKARALAAPLRAYEAELSLKRWIVDTLRAPEAPPAAQVQSLLIAWECQPWHRRTLDAARGAEQEAVEAAAAMRGGGGGGGGGGIGGIGAAPASAGAASQQQQQPADCLPVQICR